MYLKSIEVNGFKAFANRIDFKFEEGITAIVGPNGSGKSNVGDAVRWVLGEQSASKLRGSKMEDVIFAGTQTRKPSAAAYVAITLDNSDHVLPIDFNEVTVARRVYRTGESEYLINGTVSRLKDVAALFFDKTRQYKHDFIIGTVKICAARIHVYVRCPLTEFKQDQCGAEMHSPFIIRRILLQQFQVRFGSADEFCVAVR